jgi:hypothetical protein
MWTGIRGPSSCASIRKFPRARSASNTFGMIRSFDLLKSLAEVRAGEESGARFDSM